jgi:membrane protein implicated in regulation of membrane protease activity
MTSVTELLGTFGPWGWFLLAVLLFGLELLLPGVHFLWFGVAAALVGVLALTTGISGEWQVIAFAIAAVLALVTALRYARPGAFKSDLPDLNVRGAQYIGRRVVVADAIVNGRGKVKVGDTVWSASGEDTPAGEAVEVVGVDGTVLVVERIDRD